MLTHHQITDIEVEPTIWDHSHLVIKPIQNTSYAEE